MGIFAKRNDLKVVGLFGQSGSGKTTAIKAAAGLSNGWNLLPYTGTIRHLFIKNASYVEPHKLIEKAPEILAQNSPEKIDAIYEDYARSQRQLLCDFDSEVFKECFQGKTVGRTVLLVDRSPFDFYVLTLCGLDDLKATYKKDFGPAVLDIVKSIKTIAERDSENFFDAIIVSHAWTDDHSRTVDGVRDYYLSEFYTGTPWYSRLDDVEFRKTKKYNLNKELNSIDSRVVDIKKIVADLLK
jgi:hypothetical protein